MKIGNEEFAFQQKLFWLRNKIVHTGFSAYHREVAKKCYNYARLGIAILNSMDQYKKTQN